MANLDNVARVGRTRLQSAAWKPHNYIRRTASGYALLANRDNFDGLENKLPDADPKNPILGGAGDPYQGPVIRFEPGMPPKLIPGK